MIVLIDKVTLPSGDEIDDVLSLTADERQRSFYRCQTNSGQTVQINLKRGTVLQDGDRLLSKANGDRPQCIQVQARPEPVSTVTAPNPIDLLKAAYHLGNRHVALEITPTYLRLKPDPVLLAMLSKMSVTVQTEVQPFHPEAGAYHHAH